jgi:hypothetical protein
MTMAVELAMDQCTILKDMRMGINKAFMGESFVDTWLVVRFHLPLIFYVVVHSTEQIGFILK